MIYIAANTLSFAWRGLRDGDRPVEIVAGNFREKSCQKPVVSATTENEEKREKREIKAFLKVFRGDCLTKRGGG